MPVNRSEEIKPRRGFLTEINRTGRTKAQPTKCNPRISNLVLLVLDMVLMMTMVMSKGMRDGI